MVIATHPNINTVTPVTLGQSHSLFLMLPLFSEMGLAPNPQVKLMVVSDCVGCSRNNTFLIADWDQLYHQVLDE